MNARGCRRYIPERASRRWIGLALAALTALLIQVVPMLAAPAARGGRRA